MNIINLPQMEAIIPHEKLQTQETQSKLPLSASEIKGHLKHLLEKTQQNSSVFIMNCLQPGG